MVDPTAPSAPTLVSVSALVPLLLPGSGSAIYVKSGTDNTNNFQVTASSADADQRPVRLPAITGYEERHGGTATYAATRSPAPTAGVARSPQQTAQDRRA